MIWARKKKAETSRSLLCGPLREEDVKESSKGRKGGDCKKDETRCCQRWCAGRAANSSSTMEKGRRRGTLPAAGSTAGPRAAGGACRGGGQEGEGGREGEITITLSVITPTTITHLTSRGRWCHSGPLMSKGTERGGCEPPRTPTSFWCTRSTRCCTCAPTQWAATAAAAPTVTWSSPTWTRTWASWRTPGEASWTVPTHTAPSPHQDGSWYCRRSVQERTVCGYRRTACSIFPRKMTWSRARTSCRRTLLSFVTSWRPERKLSGSHLCSSQCEAQTSDWTGVRFVPLHRQKDVHFFFQKSFSLNCCDQACRVTLFLPVSSWKELLNILFLSKVWSSDTLTMSCLTCVLFCFFYLEILAVIVRKKLRTKVTLSHRAGIFIFVRRKKNISGNVKWHWYGCVFTNYLFMYNVSGCCVVLPFCCCCTQRKMGSVVGVSLSSQSVSSYLD